MLAPLSRHPSFIQEATPHSRAGKISRRAVDVEPLRLNIPLVSRRQAGQTP